jgi:hypothetical protein
MRAAKVILLGIFFSFVGFVILLFISIMRTTASSETSHAIGLSAVVAGMIEALFSPITLLVIVVAFVAACDVVSAKDFQEHFHILMKEVSCSHSSGRAGDLTLPPG